MWLGRAMIATSLASFALAAAHQASMGSDTAGVLGAIALFSLAIGARAAGPGLRQQPGHLVMSEWRKAFDAAAGFFLVCACAGVAWQAVQRPFMAMLVALGCWGAAGLLRLVTKREIDEAMAGSTETPIKRNWWRP